MTSDADSPKTTPPPTARPSPAARPPMVPVPKPILPVAVPAPLR
jgi:hypothetical protein